MQGNSPAPEVWRSQQPLLECFLQWACSSVGRAPRSQRGGQGFEPPHVHHSKQTKRSTCGVVLRGLELQNIGCVGFAVEFRHRFTEYVHTRMRVSLRDCFRSVAQKVADTCPSSFLPASELSRVGSL